VEQREQLREQVDLVHRLEAQLKKVQRELDVTRKDKAAMEKAHAIAMEEHAQARKEAEARVLEAQRQIEELQMLQSDTQQQLAEEKAVLHDQMEQMSQQLFHAQVEKEQLLDQLACMDSMIKEHQDKAKTYADLEDIIAQRDKLQQQLNESNALVMSLREQLKNNKCEVVELQKQTMELQGVEAALTEQLHSLQCDLDAANEALGAANSKIALLEQEQTELQVSLSEAKVSIKMLEQTNKALLVESAEMKLKYDETFFELQAEKNAALSELAEAQSESKSLEITVETLTSSRIMLQSKVDETTELWAEAKDQFRMKSKELEGVRGELDDLKQGNILLQGQVNETIFEKELLSKKLEEASHEASELHLEVVLLGQRNNALEESKVNIERRVVFLEHDVATLKGSLETSATEYEKSLEEKTLMVTMASEKASKAEAERNALHVKVQSLQQEQNWLQDKLAETEALWKDATSQFRLKQKLIKDLEKKLLASEESRANLEAVKKELTAQLDALSKSDSVQNASRCRFETEMKLSATNIRLSMAHCEEQKTREHLVQEKRSFEALSKSDDILRTKEEMNTLQQQLNHTKESLAALQSENVNLKTELELTTAALAEAEQQKEASLKATEELRQERDQAVVAKVALQMVTEDLQEKLDTQSKKVKKLAKLLKRVLEQNSMPTGGIEMDEGSAVNREGRVSRLPITLKLRYRDRVTGAINKMEVSAEYSGPLVDGKPEGPGVLRFECGDVYLGEFKQGEMDGVGSYVRKRPPQEGDNLCLSGMFACNSYVLPLSPTSSSSSS
jgi:chromosome segregation ATPase